MYRPFSPLHPLSFLLICCGILTGLTVFAAPTYTYEEALRTAYEHSPTLQQSEANKDYAEWKNIENFSAFLPNAQITANHFFDKKYQYLNLNFAGGPISIPQIFPTSSAGLQVNWLLFDGFSNVNTYRSSLYMKEAAAQNFSWARFQLQQEIGLAYARVVAAKRLEIVAQQNLLTLQNHLEQVKTMKSGGVSTNYDVLRVESQLSEAQTQLLDAQDTAMLTQDRLGQALGLPEPADSKESELEIPSAEKVKNTQFSRDKNHRLDLLALQNQVYASDLKDSAAGKFWVPKLSLGGNYTLYNNLTDSTSDWNNYRSSYSVGFFLTWDIFNAGLFAKSKEEKYKAIADQKSLIQINLNAPVDFEFWKKRYLYSASYYEAKKVDLDRALETVRLAQAGFKAGVRTTTEVLDAELELFRARAGIVNAQMNCIEAKLKLESALGEKL